MNQENKNLPRYLYKYFSMGTSEVDRIFTHNELWFSNPHYFNDPFDCKCLMNVKGCKRNDIKKFWKYNAKNSGKDLDDINIIREIEQVTDFHTKNKVLFNNIINKVLKDTHESTKKFRILCLSQNYSDILMWAHYADGHRGFVLQFDTKILKDNFIAPLRKVIYPPKESLPSIVDFFKFNKEEMFLTTKSSHWKYEQEWRILKHIEEGDDLEDKGNIYKFKKGLITGIILGCEISDADKSRIYMWKNHGQLLAKIYIADKDENSYKIKVDPPIIE